MKYNMNRRHEDLVLSSNSVLACAFWSWTISLNKLIKNITLLALSHDELDSGASAVAMRNYFTSLRGSVLVIVATQLLRHNCCCFLLTRQTEHVFSRKHPPGYHIPYRPGHLVGLFSWVAHPCKFYFQVAVTLQRWWRYFIFHHYNTNRLLPLPFRRPDAVLSLSTAAMGPGTLFPLSFPSTNLELRVPAWFKVCFDVRFCHGRLMSKLITIAGHVKAVNNRV